ncbi:MAG: arginine repressor [Ruminococcus sp.]
MKNRRHAKILDLISAYPVTTQEELLSLLKKEGFSVTQATVSRDIRELRLLKTLAPDGKYRYTSAAKNAFDMKSNFKSMFSSSVISAEAAENIIVIKTLSGMAQAVCASLDAMSFENIAGTLAGDDTIFVACKTSASAKPFLSELKKLL